MNIYAALARSSVEQVLAEHGGSQFSSFKQALTDVAVAALSPIAAAVNRLMADPAQLDAVLAEGAEKAEALAAPILADTRRLIGLAERMAT